MVSKASLCTLPCKVMWLEYSCLGSTSSSMALKSTVVWPRHGVLLSLMSGRHAPHGHTCRPKLLREACANKSMPTHRVYAMYMNMLMLSSSRRMYLCSINHSICSLISFLEGRNMFFKISTSSVCRAALVMRFRIFMIFTMASCNKNKG